MIDLHTHTTCSDGQDTPAELVAKAKKIGITVLSITDHDAVHGIPQAQRAAKKVGIRLIPGIEISVKGNKELHILGYGIRFDHPVVQAFCQEHQRQREQRANRMIAFLRKKGVSITLEDVHCCNNSMATGRPHFARAIVAAGYAESVQDAFDRYLTTPEFYQCVERPKPSPEEGMRVILEAGGVPVLAHPYRLQLEDAALRQLIRQLISCGLQGIECFYSRHTPDQTQHYLYMAQEFGLLITCGSDFHGETVKPEICLGTGIQNNLCITDESIVSRLERQINANKSI